MKRVPRNIILNRQTDRRSANLLQISTIAAPDFHRRIGPSSNQVLMTTAMPANAKAMNTRFLFGCSATIGISHMPG
jgi:hemin uptake protein HemP